MTFEAKPGWVDQISILLLAVRAEDLTHDQQVQLVGVASGSRVPLQRDFYDRVGNLWKSEFCEQGSVMAGQVHAIADPRTERATEPQQRAQDP
jgi:hypothetical protein